MKVVYTEKAPAAIGPYSQAMILNGVLFTSGQIPVNPATGEINGNTIETQGRAGYEESWRSLKEAGSSLRRQLRQHASLLIWEILPSLMKCMRNTL